MTPKQIEILPKPFLAVYDYVVFYLGLLWLGLISLCWTIVSVPMYFLLPSRFSTRFGRLAIMAIFRSYLAGLAFSGRFVFELQELDCLNTDTPLIVAPNHPCLLDAVMVLSRLPKLTCVMKTDLMNSVFWGGGARLARYIRNEPIRHMPQRNLNKATHCCCFLKALAPPRRPSIL
jgi:1-acyl-sn-glycerol-3-phosphate acyltransferase